MNVSYSLENNIYSAVVGLSVWKVSGQVVW